MDMVEYKSSVKYGSHALSERKFQTIKVPLRQYWNQTDLLVESDFDLLIKPTIKC